MKTIFGLGLALAAMLAARPAQAEATIAMGVEGYVPGAYSRAAEMRAAQLERLAAAAERLQSSADAAGAEVLLAGLYSGSAAAENAAPVRLEAAAAALPARSEKRSFAGVKSAIEEIGADEPAAGGAGEVTPVDAGAGSQEDPIEAADAGEEEEKPTLGGMLLAALIVITLGLLLFYAPLLLVAV
ncbi:MAG: hypothetical protein NDI60_02905 [Elusimicrobiales bacterium]|nr:hypothetical protein [Elusimicrobiales bacterium]